MPSLDPFEQFVKSYETEIVKREACLEIQQRLDHFCTKLDDLQRDLQRVNTPAEDDRYQQLEVRIRHYRYQLKYELPKLAERLLANRHQAQEEVDWIGQIIEERRQQQEREEADTQCRRREREDLQRRRHEKKRQLLDTIAAKKIIMKRRIWRSRFTTPEKISRP